MSTSESRQLAAHETEEIEADWQQFQQITHMVNHWDRPGWTDSRRSYHWMITLGGVPEVRALAAECQAAFINVDHLDLVPLDYLHVTVQGVGFTDEVDRAQIDELVAAVERRSIGFGALSVEIGPLAGSPGAIRLGVAPYGPVRAIHEMIRTAASDIPGIPPDRVRPRHLTPHASIAYSNTPTAAEPLIRRVRTLRHLTPVALWIDAVHLVELRREERQYQWNTLRSITLRAS